MNKTQKAAHIWERDGITCEEWKPCPSRPGYKASSMGRVIGPKGRVLRPFVTRLGYSKITVHKNGEHLSKAVHQLVCEAFHGPKPSDRHEVAHWNGIRSDNRSPNLRWATSEENHSDRRRHGTWPSKENHPGAQITREIAAEIRGRHAMSKSPSGTRCAYGFRSSLAREYGVKVSLIKDVLAERCWAEDKE